MQKLFLYILLLSFSLIFSCDENPYFVDCRECYEEEPEFATIILKLDKHLSGGILPATLIKIYQGNIEDNVLLNSYFISHNKWEVDVAINKKYTITATYTDMHGVKFTAVDTAYPRVRYEKSQCENPCYYIYDKVVNLAIKYTR